MALQITCVCGYVFRADEIEDLWAKAKEHLGAAHPELIDQVSRADILAQAELI